VRMVMVICMCDVRLYCIVATIIGSGLMNVIIALTHLGYNG